MKERRPVLVYWKCSSVPKSWPDSARITFKSQISDKFGALNFCQQQQNSIADFYLIILLMQSGETVNLNEGNSEAVNTYFWQFKVFFGLFLVMKMI